MYQRSDMARKAILGVLRIPARPQSENRDGRSQNVLRQTRFLPDASLIWFQPESDSTWVSQIRSESVCGSQEERFRPTGLGKHLYLKEIEMRNSLVFRAFALAQHSQLSYPLGKLA